MPFLCGIARCYYSAIEQGLCWGVIWPRNRVADRNRSHMCARAEEPVKGQTMSFVMSLYIPWEVITNLRSGDSCITNTHTHTRGYTSTVNTRLFIYTLTMHAYVCMVRLTCSVRGYVHFLVDSNHKKATLLVFTWSCELVLSSG